MTTPASQPLQLLQANWSLAEQGIVAATSLRPGGASSGECAGANMGDHVADDPQAVAANRQQLLNQLGVSQAQWLKQIHGVTCVAATGQGVPEADACWTDQPDLACVVMTADCLPVVFTDGRKVAAAHAGWRGLNEGVLEATLSHFDTQQTWVWFGPAIGPSVFEVGEEVREAFLATTANAAQCFVAGASPGKWLANIYQLAKQRLLAQGVSENRIYGGEHCTLSRPETFYSYRDNARTGRMATVIFRRS